MDQVLSVVSALGQHIGGPLGAKVVRLCADRDVAQLQKLDIDPGSYRHARGYHRDAILSNILRKLALPGDDRSRYEAAVEEFLSCERENFKTNQRLERFVSNSGQTEADLPVICFIDKWRKNFQRVLGKLPVDLTPQFSGGATTSDPSVRCTIPDKMTSITNFYPKSSCFLPLWWETQWGRAWLARFGGNLCPVPIRYNVFFTVHKNSEIDRGCCKEAPVSLGYQLAAGKAIRSRINRFYNIELQQAKPVHQARAQEASWYGNDATIDLSKASNSLVTQLVKLLCSDDWYALLDSLRAPSTSIGGRIHRLEMFSSMGNGFTFELETLVFWTLAETVCDEMDEDSGRVRVFGDDIIVPTQAAKPLIAALKLFGFQVNNKKTFISGRFRESCGGDFFDGIAVRPYFLKSLPTEPQHWISFHNGLAHLRGVLGDIDHILKMIVNQIPAEIRKCRGPVELGDIVLHTTEFRTKVRKSDSIEVCFKSVKKPLVERLWCHYVPAYVPVNQVLSWSHWHPPVQFAAALAGCESVGVIPRQVGGYKKTWVQMPGNTWLPA